MVEEDFHYSPLPGRTYSLFGSSSSTDGYYNLIRQLADECLLKYPDKEALLGKLQRASARKRLLRRARESPGIRTWRFCLGRSALLCPSTLR